MRRNKKILTVVSIIVIVLVLAITGVAYTFLYTDTFKSNKQRFFKYISQNSEMIASLQSDDLHQYIEKKKTKAYENSGDFSANIAEEIAKKYMPNQKIYKEMQNFMVTFNGKKDISNNYEEDTLSLKYSNGEKMTVDYLRQEEYYGLKIENILKKYIVVQNDNLKDFAKKMQISDITNIPNSIKIREIQNYALNENELENIKSKINQILEVNLTEDKFSKSNEANLTKYTLKLDYKELENIANTMYEAIINDEAVSNKIILYFTNELGMNEDDAKSVISKIKKSINEAKENKEDINEQDVDDEIQSSEQQGNDTIEISVYENNGKLIKTELNLTNKRITLKFNLNKIDIKLEEIKEDGNLKVFDEYANLVIEKEEAEDELSYKAQIQNRNEKSKIEIGISYKGLKKQDSISEEYSISYKSNEENSIPDIKYAINNTVTFNDSLEKKNIRENGVKINNYDSTKLQTTIGRIIDGIQELNKNQMEKLGLKEDENPIFYIIPSSHALNNIYSSFTNQENKMLNSSKIAQLSKRRELTKDKITTTISELTAKYYEDRIQNTTIASQSLDEYIISILNTETEISEINNNIRVYGYTAKYDENKGVVCTSEDDSSVLICKITNGRTSWSEENN